MSEVRSDQYVTHADAARPVLHFTGRADMEAAEAAWHLECGRLACNSNPTPWLDSLDKLKAIRHTLRTGAAP